MSNRNNNHPENWNNNNGFRVVVPTDLPAGSVCRLRPAAEVELADLKPGWVPLVPAKYRTAPPILVAIGECPGGDLSVY
jgi:hypothetical protein